MGVPLTFDSLRKRRGAPLIILLATLVLLRSRILKRSKAVIDDGERLSPEDLAEAVQQLYVDEPDGSRSLLVPFRGRVSKASVSVKFSSLSLNGGNIHPVFRVCRGLGRAVKECLAESSCSSLGLSVSSLPNVSQPCSNCVLLILGQHQDDPRVNLRIERITLSTDTHVPQAKRRPCFSSTTNRDSQNCFPLTDVKRDAHRRITFFLSCAENGIECRRSQT